jgi:hypothetical protein
MSTLRFTSRARRAVAPLSFVTAVTAAIALVSSACGSRGPLDTDVGVLAADAGTSGTVDGSVDVDGSADGDGAILGDGAALGDAKVDSGLPPIVNCGACIAQSCGSQLFTCLADPACRATFQCVVTKCLAGGAGGPDPQCLFTCSGSDPQGAVQVLRVFTCIINKCGADCQSVLGGGGLGGGRDAGMSPGNRASTPRPLACEAFAQWPEVCGETGDTNGAGE